MIEMPVPTPELLIFEPFVETDEIVVSPDTHGFLWEGNSRWVEITVGVMGKRGAMRSLTPSITVKETGDILSLEEKFQGIDSIQLRASFVSFFVHVLYYFFRYCKAEPAST